MALTRISHVMATGAAAAAAAAAKAKAKGNLVLIVMKCADPRGPAPTRQRRGLRRTKFKKGDSPCSRPVYTRRVSGRPGRGESIVVEEQRPERRATQPRKMAGKRDEALSRLGGYFAPFVCLRIRLHSYAIEFHIRTCTLHIS
jgi:hypothetical protein